jgi:hypothetical protein
MMWAGVSSSRCGVCSKDKGSTPTDETKYFLAFADSYEREVASQPDMERGGRGGGISYIFDLKYILGDIL